MTSVEARRSVSSTKSSSLRKYLGPSEDPHFIPDSPILTRQSLTVEQEEELSRSCELVLSGVITSDEDEEPSSYVMNQIVTKQTKYCENDRASFSKTSLGPTSDNGYRYRRHRHTHEDAAPSFEISKRTTMSTANILSEGLRRPASTRQNSGPRSEARQYRSHVVQTVLNDCPEKGEPKFLATTKSMTCLSSAHYRTDQFAGKIAVGKLNHISISHVEFNKSLPALPCLNESQPAEKQNAGLTRMFKMMKNKKTGPIMVEASYTRPANVQRPQTLPSAPASKKNKFNFSSMFHHKKRPQAPQVLVA